jgi:hypothetical protein
MILSTMKAGLMSFMPSGRYNIGKRGGEATHENDCDTVCVGEQVAVRPRVAFAKDGHIIPTAPYMMTYGTVSEALLHGRGKITVGRTNRCEGSWSTINEASLVSASPLAAFDPAVHRIVAAKKYEQDMADLSLFREKVGQMIEDELAALSDFEDFDETPAVHMSAGADGIFRPNT